MGTITVTSAMIIIIAWFSLVEYDEFPEAEKKQIVQKIKASPTYMGLIALMPLGIIINVIGTSIISIWLIMLGASFIFLQGIIVSLLFWRRKRWKGTFLFTVIVLLGIFIYLPSINY